MAVFGPHFEREGGAAAVGVPAVGSGVVWRVCGREIAQCDFWFPPVQVPCGFGQVWMAKQLPVLTMVTGIAPRERRDSPD